MSSSNSNNTNQKSTATLPNMILGIVFGGDVLSVCGGGVLGGGDEPTMVMNLGLDEVLDDDGDMMEMLNLGC
ncbi:hypothetical protein QYF36_019773 [Acer negundo]|nr:hypothetical protein QYF36_019773 [Acer negundo]